jgi:FAD:protein FMN transferase
MQRVAVARNAMATRFEIVLCGKDSTSLRAAGEEALTEIERLEAQLNLYSSSSEIANINARAAREPVRVEPTLFQLLQHAKRLSQETGGAFDITIAPLMRAWGLMGGKGQVPTRTELTKARVCVGMDLVELDATNFTVRFTRPGVKLDLGAIGKGYAIDQAAEIIRETGVSRALIHGGTSSVCAIGGPWKVAIDSDKEEPIAIVELTDNALSVSAIWGKSFKVGKKTYGHVVDPRTGRPVNRALLAAVILPSATETDALSTALLTLGTLGQKNLHSLRPSMGTLVLDTRRKISASGMVKR